MTVSKMFAVVKGDSSKTLFNNLNDGNGGISLGMLDKGIAWLDTNGKKMDAVMHALACGAAAASLPHDNGGHGCHIRAERVLNAMPKGARSVALSDWFAAGTNLRAKKDAKTGQWTVHNLKTTDKDYRADLGMEQIKAMLDTPFWVVPEVTKGPSAYSFDMIGQRAYDQLQRALSAGGDRRMSDDDRLKAQQMVALMLENGFAKEKAA